jgi:IclR family pca regulon transcriptional regulator
MTSTAKSEDLLPVPPPAAGEPGDPDFMLSLARGLSVIRAFGEGRQRLSVAEVARATGISRAAARRCLYTLSLLGYARSSDSAFELTPGVLALGQAYLGSATIARVAQPVLEQVSSELHESCSMAVLDGEEIVYVARAATRRILSVDLSVGSRLPAASTSMGRVLLAAADEAARTRLLSRIKLTRHTAHTIVDKHELRAELVRVSGQGYSLVDQELELGLRSLAVPIRRDGVVVAAVNVGVHISRADRHMLQREVLPVLRKAAQDIGAALVPGP